MNENMLIERACRACGISRAELLSKSRKRELVVARQMLCYALRREGYTWRKCGELVGRDNATALLGARAFGEHLKYGDGMATKALREFNRNE